MPPRHAEVPVITPTRDVNDCLTIAIGGLPDRFRLVAQLASLPRAEFSLLPAGGFTCALYDVDRSAIRREDDAAHAGQDAGDAL